MDLQQVLTSGATGSIEVVGVGDVLVADVVVLTAAAPLTVNQSRMVYLRDNAGILASDTAAIPPDWPGTVIVVTNPVDPLVHGLQVRLGLDRRRVLGYTANDTLRLRTAVGDQLGVASTRVDAWVIGEHGDACVPLLDRLRVDGAPATLSAAQASAAEDFLRGWYVRHVALDSGRSSTWTSGLGIARMIAALRSPGELWPASLVLDGEYGITGVALTVPVTLAGGGAERIHEWDLSPAEAAAMHAGAALVRDGPRLTLNPKGGQTPLHRMASQTAAPCGTPSATATKGGQTPLVFGVRVTTERIFFS